MKRTRKSRALLKPCRELVNSPWLPRDARRHAPRDNCRTGIPACPTFPESHCGTGILACPLFLWIVFDGDRQEFLSCQLVSQQYDLPEAFIRLHSQVGLTNFRQLINFI